MVTSGTGRISIIMQSCEGRGGCDARAALIKNSPNRRDMDEERERWWKLSGWMMRAGAGDK